MNKQEFVDAIAARTGSTKTAAQDMLEVTLDIVAGELEKGEKIQLVGFGTFETGQRAARTGRNPQTGAEIAIPAAVTAKFSPGKALKDRVNKPKKAKK